MSENSNRVLWLLSEAIWPLLSTLVLQFVTLFYYFIADNANLDIWHRANISFGHVHTVGVTITFKCRDYIASTFVLVYKINPVVTDIIWGLELSRL